MSEHRWLTAEEIDFLEVPVGAPDRDEDCPIREGKAMLEATALGHVPEARRMAIEAVEWETAMNGLAVAFNLPPDVAKERFKKRHSRSMLSWRRLVSQCRARGEL